MKPATDWFGELLKVERQSLVAGMRQDEQFISFASEPMKRFHLIQCGDRIGAAGDEKNVGQIVINPASGVKFGRLNIEQSR